MTTDLQERTFSLPSDGVMGCDFCDATYTHAIVIDSASTPREQIRNAATRDGWKLTDAGLEICPEDAADYFGIFVDGWSLFRLAEISPASDAEYFMPVMNGDVDQTVTIPAVVEQEVAA